jgi:hypothetical protein
MDVLIAILGVVASVLTVIGGALQLIAYREERKRLKDGNTSRDTDKSGRSGPAVGSGAEV